MKETDTAIVEASLLPTEVADRAPKCARECRSRLPESRSGLPKRDAVLHHFTLLPVCVTRTKGRHDSTEAGQSSSQSGLDSLCMWVDPFP